MPAGAPPLLILASGSPRRAALLQQIGLPFVQWVSHEPEPPPGSLPPADYTCATARAKAAAVYAQVQRHYPSSRRIVVVAADTVVHLDGTTLGKPADDAQARAMLRVLSGRTHQVYTGVALCCSAGRQEADWAVTQVRMRALSAGEIERYVRSGEPFDKAGAYGIQGRGAPFIEHIEGCYYNVVGLPLARLSALLSAVGCDFFG